MRVSPIACLSLALSISLYGQSATSVRAHFARLHLQQFRIDDAIQLIVDYDLAGSISTGRIAPPGYLDNVNDTHKLMNTGVVDGVLELLAPRILSDGHTSGIATQMSRNTFTDSTYKDCRLSRRFLWSDHTDWSVLATLACGANRTNRTDRNLALTLEGRYGLPERETFSSDGNVDVSATYQSNGAVIRLDLGPRSSLRSLVPSAVTLNTTVVERAINHFAPFEQMLDAKHYVVWRGTERDEVRADERVNITRSYKDGFLYHASIVWM